MHVKGKFVKPARGLPSLACTPMNLTVPSPKLRTFTRSPIVRPNGCRLLSEGFARAVGLLTSDFILLCVGRFCEARFSRSPVRRVTSRDAMAYRASSLPPDGIIVEFPKREVRRCLEERCEAVIRRERSISYVWKRLR